MIVSRTWQVWLWGFVILAAGLTGCGGGDERGSVSGSVTLDGVPVTGGEVVMVPTDVAAPTEAGKIENGRYTLRTTPGTKRVMIYWEREHPTDTVPGPDPRERVPRREQMIPARYNEATELTVDVQSGSNTFDFELESQ